MPPKKSPAQLQREIDAALTKGPRVSKAQQEYIDLFTQDVQNHPAAYKASVRANPAEHALLVLGDLDDADVRQFTRDLRAEIRQVKRLTGHATKKSAIPGIAKWNTYAGGTGAAEGKYSYDFQVTEGTYKIWPYTTRSGRHAGYHLKFAAQGGRPRGSHSGLWHELGSFASPQKAASAAAAHYAKGFD